MKHKPWQHSHNTFESVTEDNFKFSYKLTLSHETKMNSEAQTDPSVAPRATAYQVKSQSFTHQYSVWQQLSGECSSATQLMREKFRELQMVKSKSWNIGILLVYPEISAGYERIMPKGRKVFYQGTFSHRIAALDSLSISLDTEPALTAVKTDVDAFIVDIKARFQAQKDKQELLKSASVELEKRRVTVMTAMFSDLGFFIEKYPDSPKDIERTFDLALIRRYSKIDVKGENEYIVDIAPGEQQEAGIPVSDLMKLSFTNIFDVDVKIYTSASNDPEQEVPETAYLLKAGEDAELLVAQLGASGNRYLWIVNESATENAQVSIMEVK